MITQLHPTSDRSALLGAALDELIQAAERVRSLAVPPSRPQYVEFGDGTQLAVVLHAEHRLGTDGWMIAPQPNGTARANGGVIWVAHTRPADMRRWRFSAARGGAWIRREPRA